MKSVAKQHQKSSKNLVTLTAVKKIDRFGSLIMNSDNKITKFVEKNNKSQDFINGGFQIVNKKALSSINLINVMEFEILEKLSKK